MTSDGQLDREGGKLKFISGIELVAQRIRVRLSRPLGGWFLETSEGMPYRELILKKAPNFTAIRAAVLEQVLDVEGVIGVRDYSQSFDPGTRQLSITFTALGEDGQVQVQADGQDDAEYFQVLTTLHITQAIL